MKALTYEGPRTIRYADVPDPELPDERGALVRVTTAGICGSDLHIYGGHGFSPETGFCVGHEAVGEVLEAGTAVRRFAAGDRVLVPASVGCAACRACAIGRVEECENLKAAIDACYGLGGPLQGSQAQLVAVPAADGNLVALPDTVSDEAGIVLTDNGPTGWFAARRGRVGPGDTVAVIGLGPVGLMAVQAAFAMGAARVIGVDLVEGRRARAASLGAEPADPDDPKGWIRSVTGGGVDVALEAVGADATIALALSVARRGGRVSVVGVSQNRAYPLDMELAQVKALEFHIGLCSVQHELPTLLRLTEAGRLRPEAIVTHRFALSEGAQAYELFAGRDDGVAKVVLDPAR